MFYVIIPAIIILPLEEWRGEKVPLPFRIISSIIILIVGLYAIYYGYRKALRSEIYGKKIVIPIFVPENKIRRNKDDIAFSYYMKIVNNIEKELKQNRYKYKKKFIRKEKGNLLYWTWIKIEPNEIYLWIQRYKYGINVVVNNLISDNELLFEQIIKKIIDDTIVLIKNPFDK